MCEERTCQSDTPLADNGYVKAPRIAAVAFMVFVAGCLVAGVLLVTDPDRFFDPSEESLASSLADGVDHGAGGCSLQAGYDWYWCSVELDPGSGYGRSWVLRTNGDDCWTAEPASVERVGGDTNQVNVVLRDGPTLSGCIGFSDYVFPNTTDYGPERLRLAPNQDV